MTSHSPNAYTLSLLLHGGFVALLFLGALIVDGTRLLEKKPQIFELVAGEGDNYGALEAPALGSETGVKMPNVPVVTPAAPEPEPESSPVVPAKPEPVQVVKPPPAKPAKKELTMAEKVEKIAAQKEKRILTKFKKEQDRLEKQRELEAKRISKAEFDKANKAKASGATAKKGPRIDAEGIAKGVVGGSIKNKTGGAGGKALTRDEMDRVSEYYSILSQKIRKALEAEGVDPLFVAEVRLTVASTGGLGTAKIIRSSGNAEFDAAVVRAIRAVGSVGRPHPLGRTETLEFEVSSRDL